MIDWWGIFRNSLWIGGLAAGLAALSMASYQAGQQGVRLRQKLGEAAYLLVFSLALMSLCLGLLFSSRAWWEGLLWGLLAILLAGQAAWVGGHMRADGRAGSRPGLSRLASRYRSLQGSRRLGWGLILAGLLVISGWGVAAGVQLVYRARSLQDHLQHLEGLSKEASGNEEVAQLREASEHLSGMHRDLEAIQAWIGPLLPAGRLLRWLPGYGGDLAAASDLLGVAVGIASAGDRAFQALAPALAFFGEPAGSSAPMPSVGERLLPVLVAAQPELKAAQAELAAVEDARAGIEVQTLSPRVADLLERLDLYLPWLETAVDGALLAPGLLGADGPRTYLIVAQNNQELRATGGFMSGVGPLQVDRGALGSLRFEDGYAVDNLLVPHAITPRDFQLVLGGQLWFFRDTNWDAHFPTSARRALGVYARDRGIQADGLITLDLTGLQLLVEAVSPLQVEGIPDPVTSKNVLEVIQEQWGEPRAEDNQDWWAHRKDFMGQIARAAMERLVTGHNLKAMNLARGLKKALDEKHILIYSGDPQTAALLRARNWDGALTVPSGPSDALMVVDTNVGFNKVDAVIDRSIRYEVDLGVEEGPRARLTLTYEHLESSPVGACIQESHYGETYADMMKRCYWDYVRVYVPSGSQLLAGPDPTLPPGSLWMQSRNGSETERIDPALTEEGWAVWAAFFALPTLAQHTLMFEYQLPAEVVVYDGEGLAHYRLRVQKQPGTEAVPLRVEITLPSGADMVATAPAGAPGAIAAWDSDLRADREFEVVYHEGRRGP